MTPQATTLYALLECSDSARSTDHPAHERREMTLDEAAAANRAIVLTTQRWMPVPPKDAVAAAAAADRASGAITFRLRGFLTALTSPTYRSRRIDEAELHQLLNDAADEIDRLRSSTTPPISSNDATRTVFDYLVDNLLSTHPLPWRIDHDWTEEIYDASDRLVLKLPNNVLAQELINAAELQHAKNMRGKAAVDALLKEHGIDPW